MPTCLVNGARLHFTDSGGSGDPIVMAHGLLFDGRMFRSQVAALSPAMRCVTFDFRGQGQSEVTRDGYDLDSLTADAVGLIEHLGLAPCHFAGLSMGGFVGMRLAIRHPRLVRSLILIETSADPEPRANVPRYRLLAWIGRWFGLRAVAGKVMPIMFGERFLSDPQRAAEREELRERLIANHRVGVARATRGVIDREGVHDQLGSIRCPTLVIVGDQDVATVPEVAERIHRGIAGSRRVVIPGAGHTSVIEEPRAVNHAILEFLSGVT